MLLFRINFALIVSVLILAIGIPNAHAQNVIDNPNFDSSTQWWWAPGDGNLEVVDDAFEGDTACRISGRTQSWNGISQTLLGKLDVGKDYHFSCYVKTVGIPEAELLLEIAQTDDRGSTFPRIGTALANDTTWTQLQGGFKLEANGPLTRLHFTVNSTTSAPGTFDFILDSVSITENNWEADANARIELHRKRNFNLNLVDQAGIVQPNVAVEIDQVRHHFAFGSTLNTAFIDNPVYADFFRQNFEWATSEWYLQWKPVERNRETEDYTMADATVEFAEENGIKLRGHALAWPDARFRPEWLAGLAPGEIEAELEERIANVTTRYKSRLAHWDVCNERLNFSFFRDALGDEIEPWMFQQARIHDPNVRLCMNEFGIVDSQRKAKQYRDAILSHQASGADVGGIGLQSHFQLSSVSPKSIEIGLSELKDLGPEIWFTEFDVANPDPVERGKALETFYRYAFSVPEAQGIVMWGFWPGTHWRGADAAIVDEDWSINAAGRKYFDLINEWTTTGTGSSDVAGDVEFRGFHGEYLITTTHPTSGVKNYHLVSVLPGDGDLDVELMLDATPNSLTIYGTDSDDVFEYDLETPSMVVVNNQPVVFSLPVDTTVVRFEGLDGADHLAVKTRNSDGRVSISDDELDWVGDDFAVKYTGIETADVLAQSPSSIATIFDTPGDDTFVSYLDASTLTTSTISVTARGFLRVNAYSRAGGNDTARLFDSLDVDNIYSNLNNVTVRLGSPFQVANIRRAYQFSQTEVLSLSGNDLATVALPNGAKTISVSPNQSTIVFGDVTHQLTDISFTTFRGIAGNSDTVLLSGSAGDDWLRFLKRSTQFYGPNFRYLFTGVPNFQTAAGPDLGGRDRLIFVDSDGDDTIDSSGDTVTINGPGYSHLIKFMEVVYAYSRNGGEDTGTQSSPDGIFRLIGDWK